VLGVALLELGRQCVAALHVSDVLALHLLAVLHLDADLLSVVLNVPRTERRGIHLHHRRLHQSFRAHLQRLVRKRAAREREKRGWRVRQPQPSQSKRRV